MKKTKYSRPSVEVLVIKERLMADINSDGTEVKTPGDKSGDAGGAAAKPYEDSLDYSYSVWDDEETVEAPSGDKL